MATSADPSRLPPSELRHPATTDLDLLPAREVLKAIQREDATVPAAVAAVLPDLERLVVRAVEAVRGGGRVHYVGAGSSGRLGYLDAAEIPPTYGVSHAVIAHLAGGEAALARSVEGAEDDENAGYTELSGVGANDVVIGLAASGGTPYVRGALRAAADRKALTALVTSNPSAPLAPLVAVTIVLHTGPEVVTGSTRMKAGTALKLTLHTFSTALMVLLGRTYSNLMVEVAPSNAKLAGRQVRILQEATGAPRKACIAALTDASGNLKAAIVTLLAGCAVGEAESGLAAAGGSVRGALSRLTGHV